MGVRHEAVDSFATGTAFFPIQSGTTPYQAADFVVEFDAQLRTAAVDAADEVVGKQFAVFGIGVSQLCFDVIQPVVVRPVLGVGNEPSRWLRVRRKE